MGNKTSQQKKTTSQSWGDIFLPNLKTTGTNRVTTRAPPPLERPKYPLPNYAAPPTAPAPAYEPRIPAIAQTATHSTASWNIWKQHVLHAKVQTQDLDNFNSRISQNADSLFKKYDDRAREIQLKRARAETEYLTNRESVRPNLTINSCLDLSHRYAQTREHDRKYFSIKPDRPELTDKMLFMVAEASKSYPPTQVLTQIDGVDLTRKDIYTLTGLNWLNDEVINAYFSLIVARGKGSNKKKVYAFNTFFYPKLRDSGYSSVKRWTRKVDIFSFDYLLVPIHLGNHWCLAFIDFTRRQISYYDSLGGSPNNCCDNLLDYLRYESNDKKKQDFDDENWRLINSYSQQGIPQQRNGSDCGVFACTYAEYLSRPAKLKFSQEHMSYFRKKMIYELLTKKLLD